MPKCDFNKVALQHYWKYTLASVFSCKCVAYFQNNFSKEHFWVAASDGFPKLSHLFNLKSILKPIVIFGKRKNM